MLYQEPFSLMNFCHLSLSPWQLVFELGQPVHEEGPLFGNLCVLPLQIVEELYQVLLLLPEDVPRSPRCVAEVLRVHATCRA